MPYCVPFSAQIGLGDAWPERRAVPGSRAHSGMVDADAGGRCETGIGVRFAVTPTNRVEQLDARLGSWRTDALEVTAAFAFVDSAVVVWILARNAGDAAAYFVTLAAGRITGRRTVTGVARPLPVGTTSDTLNASRVVA